MAHPRSLSRLALAALLALTACGGDADGAASTAEDGATEAALTGNSPSDGSDRAGTRENQPQLPLPQPAGERAIGARIWEYQIELTRDTVPAGELEFHVVNAGTDEHWLIVRDDTLFVGTPHLFPGDSAVLRVTLEPGEYNVVCTIRDEFDHISEGERRNLVVL